MVKPRVIAFYLPQYHPTPDNDKWWGKGFTEWTNVARAKPLYPGHYQPKIPADLGFYDLRVEDTRIKQAELAKEAGIDGFCYYHYWFGDGKQELELPFKEVVESGKPDFPFCLCWANESWHCKFWNYNGVAAKKILIEQKYLGKEDNEKHFYSLLKAFKDPRYMTYDGRPIFMIFQPLHFVNINEFIDQWNDLALINGLKPFYFIGQVCFQNEIEKVLQLGLDAVNIYRLYEFKSRKKSFTRRLIKFFKTRVLKLPIVDKYEEAIKSFVGEDEKNANIYPTIMPNWDHTPRSGRAGYVLHESTPSIFKQHVQSIIDTISHKNQEDQVVFLKSWNEWGEGNYMEPDLKFGKKYIETLRESLDNDKG